MKIGFIDYYLDEWHANHYPEWLKEYSNGEMEVAYAYGQIESPFTRKTSREWCQEHQVSYCASIEEVVEKSDALIVLSPDNCEKHQELAKLPLMSGKRTFIDKTFSPDRESALAMFALGDAHGTPCYSASALRFAAEYQPYKGKTVKAMATWGPNCVDTYSVHQLEPVMMLMGGCPERVMALVQGSWTQLAFEWADKRSASVLCTGGNSPFAVNMDLEQECVSFEVKSDSFVGFMKGLAAFFATGEIPVSHEETVAIMAAREAALRAMENPGSWTLVER